MTDPKFIIQRSGEEVATAINKALNLDVDSLATKTLVDSATTIKSDVNTTISVGGIAKGTSLKDKNILQILEELLFPYVEFYISGYSSPSASTVCEKGTSKTISSISYSITAGSLPVTQVQLYKGTPISGKLLGTSTGATSGSFTISAAEDKTITESNPILYTIQATDGKSTKTTTITPFTFVYPFFYGVLDTSDGTGLTLNTLSTKTKDVASRGNKTYKFTAVDQHPFIAYPSSNGSLTNILDANGFDYINGFTKYTINSGAANEYFVYIQKNKVNDSNFTYTFKGC